MFRSKKVERLVFKVKLVNKRVVVYLIQMVGFNEDLHRLT